jgi:hypothetical protein
MIAASAAKRLAVSRSRGGIAAFGGVCVALAAAAASASALPVPPITINGAAPSTNSPQVSATLDSQGGDGGGGALYILTVSFPSSNAVGDEITGVSGTFNTAEANGHGFSQVEEAVGNADPGALFSVFANQAPCIPPGAPNRQSFTCPNFFGGFGPGAQQSYILDTNQNQNDPTPLSGVNVTVTECGQTGTDAVVADSCAPPGPTKLTSAKINQQARTASFKYVASHAMHYECELLYNKILKYRASCGSSKKYANPLAPGKYAFLVWGVNNGGGSANAALKKFTIG